MVEGVARQTDSRHAGDWDAEQSRSLAALLGAGLSPVQAVEVLRQQYPQHGWLLAKLLRRLRQGRPLADALRGLDLYDRQALLLLEAAGLAGRQPEALRLIATAGERQRRLQARLRAQLWLPLAMLLLASLAGLLLRMHWYGQPAGGALLAVTLPFGAAVAATTLMLRLLRRDSGFWLSWGWRLGLQRLALYRRWFDYRFLLLLRWPFEAGVSAAEAARLAGGMLDLPAYRRKLASARRRLDAGEALVPSLANEALLMTASSREQLAAAEAAGRLPEAIGHRLEVEGAGLDLCLDAFYEWLPRIYYLAVLSLGLGTLI
ncbi:hypothetical protein GCM10011348_05640 [Marinobacterium nitratireducens]|uniref:Type II secretion system protein GspF domain-containing protein n=1 Tax=Marinobacterium nitratireducens TaxID=518897 RepID=A0A918DNP6_9GAMM|nr:type II secretion system F family protein [Marinobacterium nitratireducens]GGO77022.1 hypothetical protein GCM10011348_05640 [Marinobacterium nitratireducens]